MKPVARVALLAVLGAFAIFGAAPAALATPGPHLTATNATWDKAAYAVGDTATLTITVTNDGDAPAHNVKVDGGDSAGLVNGADPIPFDLAQGASKTVTLTSTVEQAGFNLGFINRGVSFDSDETEITHESSAAANARVPGGTGVSAGRFYDSSGDNPTSAPGVGGVTMLLTNVLDHSVTASGVSDATGAFHVENVPAGDYTPTITLPAGWKLTDNPGVFPVRVNNQFPFFVALDKVPVTTTTAPVNNGPQLPVTGAPVRWMATVGLAVLVVGAVLLGLARRRRSTAA
jgi:LPXTG-motif cell wall-anchored protein